MGVEPDGESNKSFAGWASREWYMEEHVVYAYGVWQFLAGSKVTRADTRSVRGGA